MSLKTFFKQALANRASRNAQAKQDKQARREYDLSFRAIEKAIYAGDQAALETQLPAFLNKRDKHSSQYATALLCAAIHKGDTETFQKLYKTLNIYPNHNIKDNSERTWELTYPLICFAAKEGAADIVLFLMKQDGIEIDAPVRYENPEMATRKPKSYNKTAVDYCHEQIETGMKRVYEALVARAIEIENGMPPNSIKATWSSGVTNRFPHM